MGWLNNVLINFKRLSLSGVLSYYTIKVARIKDWRLGLFYVIIVILTFVYIIWNLVTNEGYLAKAPPLTGTINARAIFKDNVPTTAPSYCNNGDADNKDGCLYLNADQISINEGSGEFASLFIVTRLQVLRTNPPPTGCSYLEPNSPTCIPPAVPTAGGSTNQFASVKTHFIANVEELSIEIDHAVRSVNADFFTQQTQYDTKTERDMDGDLLVNCKSKKSINDFKNPNNKLDLIPLVEFVKASKCGSTETGLSDPFVSPPAIPSTVTGTVSTWRATGMTISAPIVYGNVAGKTDKLKYSYIPSHTDFADGRIVDIIVNTDNSLTYIVKNGVRIQFSLAGTFGKFNLQNLLLSIVAGLTLVNVATVIVDFFIIFIAKDRALYARLKFQQYEVEESGVGAQIGQGVRGAGGSAAPVAASAAAAPSGARAAAGRFGNTDLMALATRPSAVNKEDSIPSAKPLPSNNASVVPSAVSEGARYRPQAGPTSPTSPNTYGGQVPPERTFSQYQQQNGYQASYQHQQQPQYQPYN
ncbi:cytochrome c oxidase subunit 1 [Phlyctochytrium planicorne]|nr:cytochrome c oxidase subunit 1 [Phlyctochytrium planicorne]